MPTKKQRNVIAEKCIELFKESVIVQSTVTLVLCTTTAYMYATGKTVPNELLVLTSTVLGFWFRSKNDQALRTTLAKAQE